MKGAEIPVLEVRDLSIRFETDGKILDAVSEVSLRVERAEIVGLIGESGSGKTTLAMGVLGLLKGAPGIWKGGALLEGQPLMPSQEGPGRRSSFLRGQKRLTKDKLGQEMTVIFQEPRAALDPYFRVGEHLMEALRRSEKAASERELRARGTALLQDVGLDAAQLWNLYPHEISGGMAQRVMIAMALCARPKLLVADEPSTALDVTTQAKLLELFLRLRDKHDLSILLISHDIGVIREVCRRVYVMQHGRVIEQGETVEVLEHSRHPYTVSLVQAFKHPESFPIAAVEARVPAALVQIREVRKRFFREGKFFEALDGVSLEILEGETYALVGESGSGKSTLALSLLALQDLDAGEILYKGENLLCANKARLRLLRREIRMLFQHPEAVLNAGMTVRAALAESLETQGFAREEIRKRMLESLEQVHLGAEFIHRYPANLSAGEKQRVAIARALMTRPRLLVCDEPVASLDLAIQAQIIDLLRGFQSRLGLTCLFISHNLALVKLLAHRIGVMYMGRIVEEAAAGDFTVDRVRHPYTRLLLASAPSMDDKSLRAIRSKFPDVEPVRLEGGCPFRNRCPLYLEKGHRDCVSVTPPLRNLPNGGRVACHLAGD